MRAGEVAASRLVKLRAIARLGVLASRTDRGCVERRQVLGTARTLQLDPLSHRGGVPVVYQALVGLHDAVVGAGDVVGQLEGGAHQLSCRDHPVDQADVEGTLRVDRVPGERELLGPVRADLANSRVKGFQTAVYPSGQSKSFYRYWIA